ncbi:hypothetical protein D9M71_775290 [compost metagenome]
MRWLPTGTSAPAIQSQSYHWLVGSSSACEDEKDMFIALRLIRIVAGCARNDLDGAPARLIQKRWYDNEHLPPEGLSAGC